MTRLDRLRLKAKVASWCRPVTEIVRKFPGEIAVSLAAISGWAFLTAGIASLLPSAAARALWLASTGLLLVSLSGWKFLRRIATEGLYVLTRKSNA